MPRYDYPIHPLADLFPSMPDDEFQKLKADIKAHGQLEAIMLDADGVILLDGRHRLRACKELGIKPWVDRLVNVELYNAKIDTTAEAYIWSKNILRRHLTDDQRAVIAVKFSDSIKATAKENQKRKPANSVLADSPKQKPVHTRKAIAEKAKVSEHKVRQVEQVAKRAPELLSKIQSGDLTLHEGVSTFRDPFAEMMKSAEPKQVYRVIDAQPGVTIDSGPIQPKAQCYNYGEDHWRELVNARRLFIQREVTDTFRSVRLFIREAEKMYKTCGFASAEELIRDGYGIDPAVLPWMDEILSAHDEAQK